MLVGRFSDRAPAHPHGEQVPRLGSWGRREMEGRPGWERLREGADQGGWWPGHGNATACADSYKSEFYVDCVGLCPEQQFL